MIHHFAMKSNWNGGLSGQGQLSASNLETKFSAPLNLKGQGVGTNPEELILAASSSCFLITLAAILERQGLSNLAFNLKSELVLEQDKGFDIKSIHHEVSIQSIGDTVLQEQIKKAVTLAESYCLIAKALKNNVQQSTHVVFISQDANV